MLNMSTAPMSNIVMLLQKHVLLLAEGSIYTTTLGMRYGSALYHDTSQKCQGQESLEHSQTWDSQNLQFLTVTSLNKEARLLKFHFS